jgi:hypothetical protein
MTSFSLHVIPNTEALYRVLDVRNGANTELQLDMKLDKLEADS